MTRIKFRGNPSGINDVSIMAPTSTADISLNLPDSSGTILTDSSAIDPDHLTRKLISVLTYVNTSQSALRITDIPIWTKKITVTVDNVSSTADCFAFLQLQDSLNSPGTPTGSLDRWASAPSVTNTGAGLRFGIGATGIPATRFLAGIAEFYKSTDTVWFGKFYGGEYGVNLFNQAWARYELSEFPTQIVFGLSAGLFDAGSFNVIYEG